MWNIQTTEEMNEMEIDRVEVSHKIYMLIKRVVDIIGALLGCSILVLLTLIVWIANFITKDRGPIFYAHKRIGKHGKEFNMYKFRTMCNNAQEMVKDEETMKKYFSQDAIKEWKENFKIEGDPRITKVGKFLRKTSLDEVPQVINILKGDLSIIGPRPITKEEVERYEENKDKLLSITPGLTGYWAANGRSDITYKERMKMELYYVDNISFKLDLKIFFKTIIIVLKRQGAV